MFTKTETVALVQEMERGYKFEERNTNKAIDIWYPVWEKAVEENRKMGSRDFFACFSNEVRRGHFVSPFNWVGDLEMTFLNSGKDRAAERENFCNTMTEEFEPISSMDNLRQNLAELHYSQGKQEEGAAIFEELVKEDPTDIYMWAAYGREYGRRRSMDNEKAYAIYKRGIETVLAECAKYPKADPGLYQEMEVLYEEIAEVCTRLGKKEEAAQWMEKVQDFSTESAGGKAKNGSREDTGPVFAWILPKPEPAVNSSLPENKNDPCPCGSGKKYKYCCMNKYMNK